MGERTHKGAFIVSERKGTTNREARNGDSFAILPIYVSTTCLSTRTALKQRMFLYFHGTAGSAWAAYIHRYPNL